MVAISPGEQARSIVPAVGIDERAAGRTIGQHLVVAWAPSPRFRQRAARAPVRGLRYDGFCDALREFGIDGQPWTATGDFTFNSGVEASERLLREQGSVTALACANDDMAAGAMLALHSAGLEIPSAISVTGFDDTPMSEIVWPPLTTVRQPIKIPRRARSPSALRGPIDGGPNHEWIDHELVVRESTSAPNRLRSA